MAASTAVLFVSLPKEVRSLHDFGNQERLRTDGKAHVVHCGGIIITIICDSVVDEIVDVGSFNGTCDGNDGSSCCGCDRVVVATVVAILLSLSWT